MTVDARSYALLRHLTTPVVAITSSRGGRANGMIANSAQRASLVPEAQRVSVYISKINHTHDIVYDTGVFGLHLLRRDQWDLIWQLGFRSGRDADKLAGLELLATGTGCPLLVDAHAGFACRVVNAMDAGAATFFLGDVVEVSRSGEGEVMTSEYFRARMPADMRHAYETNLAAAQGRLAELALRVDPSVWPGPTAQP